MVVAVVHHVLGLSWAELAAILTIASILLGGITALLHHEISDFVSQTLDPINDSINALNSTMKESNEQSKRIQERLNHGDRHFIQHDDKLREHERELNDHETRIRVLEGEKLHEKHNHSD